MITKNSKLDNTIRRDSYNTIIFDLRRRKEIYLVGGYLRDVLRGIDSNDRDYIVRGNLPSFVRDVQRRIGGTIVTFKDKDILRIVLKDRHSFDFSRFHGKLEEDISKRDFTINALAWSPQSGLIDLYNGKEDIRKRRVCAISENNMIDDPLRMLRAFRFSAEMNGSVDTQTRKTIKHYHKKIDSVSPERITLEIFHLLNAHFASKYIKMALKDNILKDILPLSTNILAHQLKVLDLVEKKILHMLPANIKVLLHDIYAQNLSYKGLLCLEILLKDHSNYKYMPHLKMSNKIINRLTLTRNATRELKRYKRITHDKLFEIFQKAGKASIDSLVISNRLELLKTYRRFERIWAKSFLNADQIMRISGLGPGPELGELVVSLKKSQFEGKLRSKHDACTMIKCMYA